MNYKVTISTLFVNGKKYRRGDIVELTDSEAIPHGHRIEPVQVVEEKPKRKRRTKAEMELARGLQNEEV